MIYKRKRLPPRDSVDWQIVNLNRRYKKHIKFIDEPHPGQSCEVYRKLILDVAKCCDSVEQIEEERPGMAARIAEMVAVEWAVTDQVAKEHREPIQPRSMYPHRDPRKVARQDARTALEDLAADNAVKVYETEVPLEEEEDE